MSKYRLLKSLLMFTEAKGELTSVSYHDGEIKITFTDEDGIKYVLCVTNEEEKQ